jgi:hypothetical protein
VTARGRLGARVAVALVVLFLTFSAAVKLLPIDGVDANFGALGLPLAMRTALGVLELAVTALYAVPRTRGVGAVLLTGYLGGAVAVHWRIGDPLATHTLFPVWVGALAWLGLLLADEPLRAALLARLRGRRAAM